MIRIAVMISLASLIAGCQSGTTVVIEQPAEQVAGKIVDHFTRPESGLSMRETKIETSGRTKSVKFNEDYGKTWGITTLITIEPSGKSATRITIHTDEIRGGLVMTEHVRREEIEGHRMGEILRLLNIEPLPRSRWQDRGH